MVFMVGAADMTAITFAIKATAGGLVPPGSISIHIAQAVPAGWLVCDGSMVRIADHPELFSVVGNAYGNAPTRVVRLRFGWLRRLFRLPTHRTEQNPLSVPGFFVLPDLRSKFIKRRPLT